MEIFRTNFLISLYTDFCTHKTKHARKYGMNLVQLKDVELFKSLPDSTLSALLGQCQTVVLQPGETLFKDGDPGNHMYVTLGGHLTIIKEGQEISQINSGQVFGEMAIIESKNRSATVEATAQTTLMEITKPQFDSLLASNDQFLFSLLTTLSYRSRGNISDLAMGYKKKEAQEKISVHLLRILDDSPNEIYIIDSTNHHFIRGNSLALNNLGYNKDEITKRTLFDVIKNLTPHVFNNLAQSLHNNGDSFVTFQGIHQRKNGTQYNSEIRFKLLQKDTNPLYVAMAVDKTERLLMEERLETLAYFDPVTSLPNLALAKDRLQVSISQADRREKLIAVVIVSIVNYKSINHSLDPHVGELLLKDIGKRLEACLRKEDTVARLEGEDFLLILSGASHQRFITLMAQKIQQTLEPMFTINNQDISIRTSMGISLYPHDGRDPHSLVKNAQAALWSAKDKDKHSFQYYNPTFLFQSAKKVDMEADLRKALEREEFELHYQPKFNLATGKLAGMESLIRWCHPEKGWVPTMEFILAAEENRLIIPIGEWVLQTACQQIKKWQSMGLDPINVAVNLSGHQFNQDNFVQKVEKLVVQSGVDPRLLELELTETILMENSDNAISRLKALSEFGLRLSIDDFGTGFSSLKYLKDMPIHSLKIDQTFVHEHQLKANSAIIQAVISLAQNLGLQTIAEGVETESQLAFLKETGCELGQGIMLSPVLSPENMTRFLQTGSPSPESS
jgi:diguanylate cyclase (GGDEF)-like protein/PAS domain S-box-containing protein